MVVAKYTLHFSPPGVLRHLRRPAHGPHHPAPTPHQAEALLAKTGSLNVSSSPTAALQAGLMESHISDLCNTTTFHRQGERTQSLVQNDNWEPSLAMNADPWADPEQSCLLPGCIQTWTLCPCPQRQGPPRATQHPHLPCPPPSDPGDGLFPGTLPPQTARVGSHVPQRATSVASSWRLCTRQKGKDGSSVWSQHSCGPSSPCTGPARSASEGTPHCHFLQSQATKVWAVPRSIGFLQILPAPHTAWSPRRRRSLPLSEAQLNLSFLISRTEVGDYPDLT